MHSNLDGINNFAAPSFPGYNGSMAGPSNHTASSTSIDLTGDDSDEEDVAPSATGGTANDARTFKQRSPRETLGPSTSRDKQPGSSSTIDTHDDVQIIGANHPMSTGFTPYHPSLNGNPIMNGDGAPPSFPSSSNFILNPWAMTPSPSTFTPPTSYMVGTNGSSVPAGYSASSAIDLTNSRIPSPPPLHEQKPICIGAINAKVLMMYPAPVVTKGYELPEGSKERLSLVIYRGGELLKVKLKLRHAGARPKPHEAWPSPPSDAIQVMTPGMSCYIGELDARASQVLIDHVARGLVRLEGFLLRNQPEPLQYTASINVLLFTLPSNVKYIAQSLMSHGVFLRDPAPPYDPARHADRPKYINAHGGDSQAAQAEMQWVRSMYSTSMPSAPMDKTTQVEVQRKQVDEVFESIESGAELEESVPGPLIKATLFPHQRKALTFLLEREQDMSSLKKSRKYWMKQQAKEKIKGEPKVHMANDAEIVETAKKQDHARSLWEPKIDGKGRIKSWRNKVSNEEVYGGKHDKPPECKGAILADDMGLGKTLSVMSLIAATRGASYEWARKSLEKDGAVEEEEAPSSTLKASDMTTRIFGMPVGDDDQTKSSSKSKKRKFQDKLSSSAARRSQILCRSKATLLICPMSTISNWEDQIKEHWDGRVEIVGGTAGAPPPKDVEKKYKPRKKGDESDDSDLEDYDTLRVYIYHGANRRADPEYVAGFDVVVTSYNTLALEFSKNSAGGETGDNTGNATPSETAVNSGAEDDCPLGDTSTNPHATKPEVEAEIKAMEVAAKLAKLNKKGKGKKTKEPSPLQQIDWFRVVLDEAHYIKSAITVASLASCDLEADRRIALTGTPIQNRIEDVWALFKFLRLYPVDEKDTFNRLISQPCKMGEQIGVARLQLVMRCCTLRRTKDTKKPDGSPLLELPERKELQLWLDLREDERLVYDIRSEAARNKVHQLRATNSLGKNYANVLSDILRLRQICDHVDLASADFVEEDFDGAVMDYDLAMKSIHASGMTVARALSVVCFLKDSDTARCVGCNFDYGDNFPSLEELGPFADRPSETRLKKLNHTPLLTKCQHIYCPKCFKSSVYSDWAKRAKTNPTRPCAACQQELNLVTDVIEIVLPDENGEFPVEQPKRVTRKKYVRPPGEKPNLSTKMQFLHDELLKYSKMNPDSVNHDPFADVADADIDPATGLPLVTKSVVFSQWTTMLDRISDMLDEARIKHARLDGTMSREERHRAMRDLASKKGVEVLLVSTRAGGVGLNLTAASRCYLVDPYWNPSVESQAIDRIHRLGQTRPVTAIKLMINESIEQKLAKIQEKKSNLANLSLKNMSRKELLEKKAEELVELFG
ncbi:SNF2 family N-terminal domain-domain-containing protein [Naematelia encephala]|uniref:SNF2 family N-terminal domain-domain-containing protein n=1 Tax=Naematelia encephala TaxID=71784 RepID=A0A1Y2B662_9TREE|nr:SNF2 family N-terminal domain-domain-containing protein [Naematelia encephala]